MTKLFAMPNALILLLALIVFCWTGLPVGAEPPVEFSARFSIRLAVTSQLPAEKVPLDPFVDFEKVISAIDGAGVLDPNSIEVLEMGTGRVVSHSLGDGFAIGNRGRVQWVAARPDQRAYEIRFKTTAVRSVLLPRRSTPLIGVGDLVSYNAGVPRPIAMRFPARLVDLTGDGRLDLVGTLPHYYAPGGELGGIVCIPQVAAETRGELEFGEMVRLRYKQSSEDDQLKHFMGPYLVADVVDVNRDGRPDVIYTTTSKTTRFQSDKNIHKYVHVFLNSGRRDAGGMPEFVFDRKFPLPTDLSTGDSGSHWWGPVRVVDLDGDGVLDLVVGRMFSDQAGVGRDPRCYFLKNTNPKGWPMRLASEVEIDCGCRACFLDVDGDGRRDAIGLILDPDAQTPYRGNLVTWRKNLGGRTLQFGPPRNFPGSPLKHSTFLAAVDTPRRRGLLLNDKRTHSVRFLEHLGKSARGDIRFRNHVIASRSADVVAGDQASPFPCDWDGDGDWDLVVGGGNGWPTVILNEGTDRRPRFAVPRQIPSEGQPIRIFMSQVFPGIRGYFHDMGYPFPSYVDWDGDKLPDLMLPNITNRVFWYRNVGTRTSPKFGPRQQVVVDGYPETAETMKETARRLGAGSGKWNKRMLDPASPFGWRARAGFGDFNGDGLVDMVHADGRTRHSGGYAEAYALFVQYRDREGHLKLRRDRVITLPNGKPLKCPGYITSQAIAADWDRDGLLDLVCHWGPTNTKCQPMFVRNIGTRTEPRFDHPQPLSLWGQPLYNLMKHGPYWAVHDIDGDGRPDLLAGCAYGNYAFYRRTAMDMPSRPTFQIGKARKLRP
ncbi:MAG: VCBS repeat-containing protein [Planctomycetota bacterium]|nr:VCBS repeat-containing protein [Planctomycetota bacterium]